MPRRRVDLGRGTRPEECVSQEARRDRTYRSSLSLTNSSQRTFLVPISPIVCGQQDPTADKYPEKHRRQIPIQKILQKRGIARNPILLVSVGSVLSRETVYE